MRFSKHTEAGTFNRKELVRALAAHLGVASAYNGMPTRSYTVGPYTIDRDGSIVGEDITPLRDFLIGNGYARAEDFEANAGTGESGENEAGENGALADEPEGDSEAEGTAAGADESEGDSEAGENRAHADEPEGNSEAGENGAHADEPKENSEAEGTAAGPDDTMFIGMPVPEMTVPALRNLVFMLYTKQYLLNRAFGEPLLTVSEALITRLQEYTPESLAEFGTILKDAWSLDLLDGFSFENGEVKMAFPFDEHNPEKWTLYSDLLGRIVRCALDARRTNPALQKPENERYFMHSWLIRLGCGGPDSRALRRLMLGNLNGYCAFPDEDRAQKHRDKYREIRRIKKEIDEEAHRR